MELLTPRLVLRDFRLSDFDALSELESQPETYHYEGPTPSADKIRLRLEKLLSQNNEKPRMYYRLAVTLPPHDRLIGRVSLVLLNDAIREWELGWATHPQEWRQGYASEAARRMLGFAFEDLGAHRVSAFCHVLNAASVRVMEKLSMQKEGHLRGTRWWHEDWHDEFIYAILEREWHIASHSQPTAKS